MAGADKELSVTARQQLYLEYHGYTPETQRKVAEGFVPTQGDARYYRGELRLGNLQERKRRCGEPRETRERGYY